MMKDLTLMSWRRFACAYLSRALRDAADARPVLDLGLARERAEREHLAETRPDVRVRLRSDPADRVVVEHGIGALRVAACRAGDVPRIPAAGR